MVNPKEVHAWCDLLERSARASWEGSANLVGTLVDRHILRLAGVGEAADDAIIVFLEAIRNASFSSPVFGRLWKTMRDDKTVDLWLYNHEEQWKSVSFEFQFHRIFPADDLFMVMSTFVPYGIDGDRSHYPIDQSTSYMRSTQHLHAVLNMVARRVVRGTSQDVRADEGHRTTSDARDTTARHTLTRTNAESTRYATTGGSNSEYSVRQQHGRSLFGYPKTTELDAITTTRNHSAFESVHERRSEHSLSEATDRSQSERTHQERSSKWSATQTTEDLVELTEDVTFMAVGPDFTQPDKMLHAWRTAPGNGNASLTIDLMLAALPAIGPIIENGVAHRRLATRARRSAGSAAGFWQEADQLIAKYNPLAYGQRVELSQDGYPHPIQPADIARAIQAARAGMGQLTGRSHFLLEELDR